MCFNARSFLGTATILDNAKTEYGASGQIAVAGPNGGGIHMYAATGILFSVTTQAYVQKRPSEWYP